MFTWRLLTIVVGVATATLGFVYWHNEPIKNHPILPVAFEHLDHQNIKCTDCHHNYIDDTGHDSCYSCHKHDDTVALEIEEMFHDFCRDCHVQEANKGLASGPFRVCSQCHNDSGRMAANRSGLIKR